jgi:hypothetical protein
MTNHLDSNGPSDNDREHSGPQAKLSTATPEQSEVRKEGNNGTNEKTTTTQEMRREFRWFEFGSLFINVALVIIGVFALQIYNGQLTVMRGQLGEIIKQYPELEKSANAAKRSADAATDSVKATQDVMRADQRAWVGIGNITGEPSLNEIWKIVVVYHNSGRTPATHVSGHAVVDPVPKGKNPNFSYAHDAGFSGGMIPPGGDYNASMVPTISKSTGKPSPITQPLLDAILGDEMRVYIHGEITYDDIFGCRHRMMFCYFSHAEPKGFGYGACRQHNDTGDEGDCRQ